jgi:MYXO-CTERM domain-containing protein
MPRFPLAAFAALAVLLGGWPQPARAQLPADARFSYDLLPQGGSSALSGSLSYTPGTPFALQVYLRQTAGSTDVLSAEGGLVGGGVRLTYGNPSGTPGVINVASVNDIAINTGSASTQFNDPATSNASRQATTDFAQFIAVTDFTRGALPDANGRVFLGTVTFQTPGGGNGTTVLTASEIPQLTDTLTFSHQYVLDSRIDPVIIQVAPAPTPEPGAVLAIGAAGLAAYALRARRRASSAI